MASRQDPVAPASGIGDQTEPSTSEDPPLVEFCAQLDDYTPTVRSSSTFSDSVHYLG